VDIAEAPPWLVPQHLELDYEIFHLRAMTVTPEWLEVIGNARTGETRRGNLLLVTYNPLS
jgi:hypothetical protein